MAISWEAHSAWAHINTSEIAYTLLIRLNTIFLTISEGLSINIVEKILVDIMWYSVMWYPWSKKEYRYSTLACDVMRPRPEEPNSTLCVLTGEGKLDENCFIYTFILWKIKLFTVKYFICSSVSLTFSRAFISGYRVIFITLYTS